MSNNQICQMGDTFITKPDSKMLKGLAILMMVSMHLMRTDWMVNPGYLIDPTIAGESLSHILAQSIHASPAIFAFISGYAWGGELLESKAVDKNFISVY